MHTTFSDGVLSPSELVSQVHEAGVQVLSITDHDTTSGLEPAAKACKDLGLGFVTGVEISCFSFHSEVHLLGYGFDPADVSLQTFLDRQERERAGRALQFLEQLKVSGALPAHTYLPELPEGGSYGRPHLADLLVEAGSALDRHDAFERFLVPGTPTFVPKRLPPATEAISTIHEAGGVAVLAHPGHSTAHRVLLDLVQAGLDGLEVVHPAHDPMLKEYYTEQANRFALLKTGGSDYHGPAGHRPASLGRFMINLDPATLKRLRTQW